MSISLTPEQEAWLDARVVRGDFPSVADAARRLIDERIAERMAEEEDDLVWAKPYVDEALADVACGKVLTREQHEMRMDALLSSFEPVVPNAETIEAMKAARQGKLVKVGKHENLLGSLNAVG